MKAALFILRGAYTQELASRSGLIARSALFGIIMVVFSRLWRAAYAGTLEAPASPEAMTWYMAATEWIVLSVPATYLEIERDVRSGEVACQLARPVSYSGMQLARSFGAGLAYLTILGPVGFALALLFTGTLPPIGWQALAIVPLGVLAIALAAVFNVAIGLGAFWLQESGPLFWVWQKLLFVLGGLILPLSFYPGWLQSLASRTPFAAMLGTPASLMLRQQDAPGGFTAATAAALALAFWIAAALSLLAIIQKRADRIIDVNGG